MTAALKCPCGGTLTIDTETLIGRTIESCDGPCGYRGKPRPDPLMVNRHARGEDIEPLPGIALSAKLCIEGCGRRTMTPKSERCRECKHAHDLALANGRMRSTRGSVATRPLVRECVGGCGRPPATRRSMRCAECAAERIKQTRNEREKAARKSA